MEGWLFYKPLVSLFSDSSFCNGWRICYCHLTIVFHPGLGHLRFWEWRNDGSITRHVSNSCFSSVMLMLIFQVMDLKCNEMWCSGCLYTLLQRNFLENPRKNCGQVEKMYLVKKLKKFFYKIPSILIVSKW